MQLEPLTSIARFDELLAESADRKKTFVVFKHSTRCLISKMALKSFSKNYKEKHPVYLLDIIRYRDVSNHIERISGVHHQSPQLIAIRNGKAFYHASHYSIQADLEKHMPLG